MNFESEVEDDGGYLEELKGEDEEKEEADLNDDSELEERKEETKWDDIDWSEDKYSEREKTKWDDIDWSEDKCSEREKTKWDDIDWSEDRYNERDKNEKDKNDDQNEEYNKEDYVENVESQSVSTVLINKIEEIEGDMEHQEQEEEIEIRPEEYQNDTEPIVNSDEIEFIKDVEELAEHARETRDDDENVEPQAEKENAAYYAEQYYETLKEKDVVNDQNSKEEQEAEELRQEVTEELKGDQESGYKSDELEKEDITKASKEITSTEEFEYLWEVRDKLDREGKTLEEIEEVMHEAEELYETLKNAEKLYGAQELEELKLVDHEDEATEEDLKEDLDRVDLVEQAVELEEKLFQQGESQEEIDKRVDESIETTKFEEKLEEIIETQELEKLKLVDHEDEANEEDLKEDLDRVDLVEQAVELEEKLFQQGESQEEIEKRVEESIETTKFEEKLEEIIENEQESIVNEKLIKHDLEINEQNSNENVENKENLEVLKPELDAIESESESNKDFLEESTKIVSEESDEEETEHLQELYRQETGRRPIYSKKKTNGYSQWLEQRELRSEKIKNSKSESEKIKEIKEEDWKTTLNQWIKEASEEVCNAEFKSELKKALESYNEFEDLARKFMELYEKGQNEKLSEKEKYRLKSLTDKLHELNPIQFELLLSVFFIKKYITEQYWYDFWNKPLVNRVISKFFKHISQKYKELRIYNFINIETDSFQKDIKTFLVQKHDFNKEELEIVDEFSKYESNPEIEKNDELEKLKQKYKEETGKRPIHAGTRMFGVYGKYIPTKEYENSVKLREDRNKKTKERIATLKKTLFKLYHDIGKEVEKYSYLAGIATNPTGVTRALLGSMHCHAGLRSLEGIIKRYAKIEKIYEQIQDKLKEKIEFSHWAIIKDKFEKAISLKQRVTDLYLTIGRGVHKRDTFDIRVSKFPSEKADLMVDLFDIALKYIFTSQQQKRNYYVQVFSDIIFGNSWFLSHAWLGSKPQSQRKALPTSLFLILFNIFRLDTTKIRNRVGDIRKFTKSSLADFKLACYSRVKKLFLDSYISDYLYNYDDDPKNDRYVGSKHFELEFDLLWSVWYAYVEWYANQNPGILDNIFDHDSPFRKKFGNSFFFRGFTGYSSDLFKNIQSGLHISKRHVFSMFNKLTLMRKNIGTSSFPSQHAIENALSIVENYLQVRHPKKEGNRVLAFQDYFFVNNILVSSKGTLLPKIYRNYLEVASNLDGSFPFSAAYYQKNHPNDYQRCSNFEIQVGTIAKDYFEFIQDRLVNKFSDLKGDKLLVVDSVNSKNSPKPIQDLLKLVKSFSGSDPKNFLNPSHQAIIGMAKVKLSDYVLATELPVWRKVGAKLVTGHVDLVLLIGDTLFICDYKPGDMANPNAKRFSHSFLISFPQVAAYSKLHRSKYSIKRIYCVTFNEDGHAWIYQDKLLDSLENLLIIKGYSDWLIWKKYII